ncbi:MULTISPECIES: non-heme iron oxygenase ferredoxin subunit [unclassified Devosia]|uniref:non-heme iron oxygenase ferredoxin subunit n=1 Tax=unclassified Devosia TaxID=196773 RepID=UPI00145CFA62|nr:MULTISPECIES: non-heme iron oxygenase ferredoxin subunit [unclassified Devosia]MBJ6988036.1 non-heme iron oxygenase ferredoxin subunit [Devosia sp. MC521]MBJ7578439.1 non-heme iron oxygenase ferredoxin subunit [Devosia sp. MC532]MBK1794770.1 non-heme iron oxygenase ferredoxin subunit [Devosia sp. WQ 349K1]QMW62107.1 non-heme iron oxygenase ferredoxin subunit [Devosia sp. MC521]
MSSSVRVAAVADVSEGEILKVFVGDRQIALYHMPGGEFRATDDLCSHGQAFLSDGWLTDEGHVECPLHGGCFDTLTGEPTLAPCEVAIRAYKVRVEGEEIHVELAD